ncbi:hypothetical protein NLI96_g12397 [Meripilus lineatus]|uniref:Uncharacterized protein n=1 Tax=Meripilus lineatus TaxID=2056292 RepID=A0AAD5YCF7_9APHY|nr:hypothetical protein NLI96_g12397 [Physisporinus lineatus]
MQSGPEHMPKEAMVNLSTEKKTLDIYQVLEKKDLITDTAVMDPYSRGSRNAKMSWIWKISAERQHNLPDWLTEIYRVNFHRARARMLRYKEEKVLLELEMSNSRRSIEYRVAQWRQRANDTSGVKGVEIIQQSLATLAPER